MSTIKTTITISNYRWSRDPLERQAHVLSRACCSRRSWRYGAV